MILSKSRILTNFSRKLFSSAHEDPRPYLRELQNEPHILQFLPTVWILGTVVLPVFSVYCWYHEYQEKFVRKERLPFPGYDILHARTKKYPFGDGEHTPLHHPYFNFTPKGYETDKDGKKLPKGVYALE